MRAFRPRLLLAFALQAVLVSLCGCGWGGTPTLIGPAPDFKLSITPASAAMIPGDPPAAFTAQITPINKFSAAVALTVATPAGMSCIEPACAINIVAGTTSAIFHLVPSAGVTPGTYAFTFTALSGALTHTAMAMLTINAPPTPDFAFSVAPASSSTVAGTAAPAYSFTITPSNGFAAPVTIAGTAPAGIACTQTSCALTTSLTQVNNALQFTPSAAIAPGAYTITFTATSGALTHTATAILTVTPLPPAPDFSFAVAPLSATLTAGSQTPAYSFTITPSNGFASPVVITAAAPTGFTCAQNPCTVTTSTSIANALQFSTDPLLAAGTYTLTFTATSGTLTHIATTVVAVTAPPPPPVLACSGTSLGTPAPTPGPTAFVYTGGVPAAALYDSRHNVIFVSNRQLGEIDVISPNSLSVISRIPVTQPEGLDLSADLSTLIVGTDAHFFYRIDTTSLCVIDRPYLTSVGGNVSPQFPVTLADGSILFQLSGAGIARWTAAGGDSLLNPSTYPYAPGHIMRSGDHQHAFVSEQDSGGYIARYDVSTGAFVQHETVFGDFANVVATNYDGSRLYYTSNCCGLSVDDTAFNTLASHATDAASSYFLSADGSRLYGRSGVNGYIVVYDATNLTPLGYLPAQSLNAFSLNYYGTTYDDIDGAGRFIVPDDRGIHLAAMDPALQSTAAAVTVSPGSLSVDSTEFGTSTVLGYSNVPGVTPVSVIFSETTSALPGAVTISVGPINNPQLNITVPNFPAGCADLAGRFNIGLAFYIPGAFCYGPTVYDLDGDAGPSTGGATITIYGKGFGQNSVVRVGGTLATTVAVGGIPYGTIALEPEQLLVTVPAGNPGPADITITNGGGASLTLPKAFTYFVRQDTAIPATAAPAHLIFDAVHGHLLWTDSARNLLVVSSTTTGQTLQEVPVGKSPLGLSLSPDSTKVAVATTGDNTVTLYDATSFTRLQSAPMPTPGQYQQTYTPQQVVIMNNGKVLIAAANGNALSGGYDFPGFYSYDLASNVIAPLPGLPFAIAACENFAEIVASADGSLARIGDLFYTANTGAFATFAFGSTACTQIGLSADGAVTADTAYIADSLGRLQNLYNVPSELGEKSNGFIDYNGQDFAYTLTVNASGSLAVEQFASEYFGIHTSTTLRMFDLGHGSLVRTVSVPGGFTLPDFGKPIALDPSGQNIWMFTPSGLTELKFLSDPLSIGEVQTAGGTLTLLGSGFTSSLTVSVDGHTLSAVQVTGTITASAPLPPLASGMHNVTVSNPGQPPYVLPAAFTTP